MLRLWTWKVALSHHLLVAGLILISAGAAAQENGSNPAPQRDQQAADAIPPGALIEDLDEGFVALFDGRLLSGWEGDGTWFRVDEGAIVAGDLDRPIPHNYFLATTRTFEDFELRLEVKAVGPGANGGVQFRSRRVPNSSEVSGYQADVGGVADRLVWGSLYDESRRNRFLQEADAAKVTAAAKPDDWNDYRIRCVGPKIELFINGVKTVDYTETDDSIPRSGVIAVQVHSGPPVEIWYRKLRIKPL